MTTKANFIAAVGGAKLPVGDPLEFVRSSGNILTATAHGLKTGAGPYKVLTTNADAPAGLTAAVRASGTLTGTSVIATDVAVIDGKTYTFIASPAADGDVDVTAVDANTMANLAQAITQRQDAGATVYDPATVKNPNVEAEVTSMGALGAVAVLTVTAKILDAALGNAIDISSVDATIVTSGATLAGGVDGTNFFIIRLSDDTFSLATTRALALAGTAVTITDAGTGVHTMVATADTVAEQVFNAFVAAGAPVGRSFERFTARGWGRVNAHQLRSGDIMRVLDNGEPQPLAPNMGDGDISGLYLVSQVQQSALIAVGLAGGGTEEVAISLT